MKNRMSIAYVGDQYSRKEIKQALKSGIVAFDMPAYVHRELERRRQEIEKGMLSNKEAMDLFMRQQMASRWRPVKKPTWVSWFYKHLGVSKTPKVVSRIKQFFR